VALDALAESSRVESMRNIASALARSRFRDRQESHPMSDTVTRAREVQRTFGRVYQTSPYRAEVVIDWQPSSPIMGCKVLTHGQAVFHKTEGKVVRFPAASRRGRRTSSIVVRTKLRPDLLELFELAVEMESELEAFGPRPSSPAP
jgi:hypothetical protein